MAWLIFIALAALVSLYFVLFLLSSLSEKEWRAAFVSLFIIIACLGVIPLALQLPEAILIVVNIAVMAFLALLFLPFGKSSTVRIVGERSRHDERDIMFARARYVPGTAAYEDYYRRHPERKRVDDELRALPQLLKPGGSAYEPIAAKVAETNFEMNEKLIALCDGEPAAEKISLTPADAAKKCKDLCLSLGAVDAGIAALDQNHLYSHIGRGPGGYGTPIQCDHANVIVFAVEMDFEAMRHAPHMPVVVESSRQYFEAAKIAINVAAFIRSLGYEARAHMDANYRLMLPAAAVDAGLGEVARIGYLIHSVYGARIRLGAVTTSMPLARDKPKTFGVQDFCRVCKKCAEYCPAGAISYGPEKVVRGVKKWSTNQEACYRFWRKTGTDCGICMRVCPYSKPANFAHNVIRSMIHRNPVSRRLAVIGDKALYRYSIT